MAANDEGAIIKGAYGPGNIPDELLKYDKDNAGALLYLKRGTTKLMHMIHKRFGKRSVNSFTPKWFDVQELENIFTVTADQVNDAAGWNRVVLTNSQAIQLQPGDLLSVDGLFLADGRAGGTAGTYSSIFSSTANMEEQIMVTQEPRQDDAGTGYSYVYIRRGYANSFSTGRLMSQPSLDVNGLIKNGTRLLHLGNAQWTGSDAPRGRMKNIEVDSNPLQIMRFAFEEQNETNLEKTFLSETPMSINQKLALNNLAFLMEYRAMFNRPVKEQQDGKWRYAMGGLFDFISNYIDYSAGGTVTTWDWLTFQRNVMAPLFELGGSSEKIAFMSIGQYIELTRILWNRVSIETNEAWSKSFGFEIKSIYGGGGTLNFVPSWVYSQNVFRSRQMLVLDFGGPYFKIDVLEDLHLNKGPGGAGLQLPGQEITKFEYQAKLGLQRRAAQYHAIVTGLPTV